jgi:hypothetical protein
VSFVLDDRDPHVLDGIVSPLHSLPCISAGGAPMM